MLDPRTLTFVLCATFAVSAVMVFFSHRQNREIKGPRDWAIGLTLIAVGVLLLFVRGHIPMFVSVVLANGLVNAGNAMLLMGTQGFLGYKPSYRLAAVAVIIFTLPFWILYDDPMMLNARIHFANFANASLSWSSAAVLFWAARHQNGKSYYLAGSAFFLEGLVMPIRSIILILSEEIITRYSDPNITISINFFALIIIHMFMTLSLVILISARLNEHLMAALETERKASDALAELSVTDALTGVANRRHFDEVLSAEYQRMCRTQLPLTVILIDIDYFKRFNDTYGHVQGDDCLRTVAQTIQQTMRRPQDLTARYGGEEFVGILPDTNYEAAISIATQIKDNIANLNYQHETSDVADHVTASLGLVTVICDPKDDNMSPKQILRLADERLYCAKKNGRNCVSHMEKTDFVLS